jgi:hypothetical protein
LLSSLRDHDVLLTVTLVFHFALSPAPVGAILPGMDAADGAAAGAAAGALGGGLAARRGMRGL